MAQRNIDFGTFPDDPDADAIRTAFQKTQENFNELFGGLQDQAVISVNRTAGAGITVNSPTGNVIVTANIACVQVSSNTLGVSRDSASYIAGGNATITSSSQTLVIELPNDIANVDNIELDANLTANVVKANLNVLVGSNAIVLANTGNATIGNASISGVLNVTGNATVGNISTVNGTFSNSITVTTAANVGALNTTTASVTGNLTAGNANVTGNISANIITANFFYGDGSNISNVTAIAGNLIESGSSQVFVALNGNVTSTVAGYDTLIVTATGANVTGYINATGNLTAVNANLGNSVTANYFVGNLYGTANTATSATTAGTVTTNAQPNITSVGTLTSLSVTGNVSTGNVSGTGGVFTYVSGDGGNLSNITGANVTGAVGYATVANSVAGANVSGEVSYAASANSVAGGNVVGTVANATHASTANTVVDATQSNITSVGTLTGLNVNGTINAVNITANTGVFTGNGSGLSAITGANVTGTVANATFATSAGSATTAGTVTTNAQSNITSVGTLSSLAVTADTTSGNVYANSGIIGAQTLKGEGGNISNIQGANVSGTVSSATTASTAGTVTTNAQPNITSVGSLTSLTVSGNINAGNVNLASGIFSGNGSGLSQLTGANVTGEVSYASTANSVAGSNVIGAVANATYANSSNTATTAGTVTTNVQPNITSLGTLTSLSVSGNISANSANTLVRVHDFIVDDVANINRLDRLYFQRQWDNSNLTATIQQSYTYSSGQAGYGPELALMRDGSLNNGLTHVAGTINFSEISKIISDFAYSSGAGGQYYGNLNIQVKNSTLSVNPLEIAKFGFDANNNRITTITGNLTANNINGGNLVSANFIQGDGGLLTNISVSTGSYIENGNSEVRVDANSNVRFTVAGNANVIVATGTGANINGYANVSGNLSAGNVSASLLTGTLTTSTQPNITSVGTLTSLDVSGNINSGNITNNNTITTANLILNGNPVQAIGTITPVTGNVVLGSNVTITGTTSSNATSIMNISIPSSGTWQIDTSVNGNLNTTSGGSGDTLSYGLYYGNGTLVNNSETLIISQQPGIGSAGRATGSGQFIVSTTGSETFTLKAWASTPAELPFIETSTTGRSYATYVKLDPAATISTTANVTFGNLTVTSNTSTSNLSVSNTASVTGNLTAGNVYANSGTISGSLLTGSLTTASQPNITSVGTLSSLAVTANVTAGNVYANSGTIGASTLKGEGGNISNIQGANVSGTVSSATSATTAGTVTTNAQPNITSVGSLSSLIVSSNINAGNLNTTGVFNGNGASLTNIPGANVTGTVANATYATSAGSATTAGTVTTNAQPNITSVGTLTGLTMAANADITLSGTGSEVSGANLVSASYLTGTLTTAAQPNITSVGSLTSLIVNGNINAGNIAGGNLVSANFFSGNGSGLTALNANNISSGTLAQARLANSSLTVNGTSISLGGSGTITAANPNALTLGTYLTGTSYDGSSAVTAAVDATTTNTANKVVARDTNGSFSANIITATLSGAATTAGTVTTNAQPNITSVGTLTSLAVTGNLTAGNLIGTLANGNSNVRVTANGNINISSGGTINGLVITSTGVNVDGTLNATGIITGNGSGLSAIAGGNVTGAVSSSLTTGTVTTNAQPNITSTGTLTGLTVSGNITAQANVNMSGYVIRSVGTGISANGSTQGTATAITKEMNVVSTVSSGQGVVLPTAVAGMVISITNTSANSLAVYPASSAAINSLSANAAFTHPAGATLQFIAPTTTQWYTVGATYA